jgi:hypothetical protein
MLRQQLEKQQQPQQQQQQNIAPEVSKDQIMLDLAAQLAAVFLQLQQHHRHLEKQPHQHDQHIGSQEVQLLREEAVVQTEMPVHTLSVASVLAHHEAFFKSPGTSSNTSVSSVSSSYSPAGNIRRTHERLQRPRVEQERIWNSTNTSQFSSGDSASWSLYADAGAHRCTGLFSDLKPLRK